MNTPEKPVIVFKGGTGFNRFLQDFKTHFPHTTYIVPITDDGGSSSEIVRVFGGPSIGDLRSTLTRLSDEECPESYAIKKLLEHRLPSTTNRAATVEWHHILDNTHPLYTTISKKQCELIHRFLWRFEAERLDRISSQFDMRNGSIGNFFFSGMRMTFGSLQAAIYLYSTIAHIPSKTQVLPIIDSNDSLGIGAKLENGESLIGQCTISHPTKESINVDKESFTPLPFPIKELFYVDNYKHRIEPKPHPKVLQQIQTCRAIIYGVGSLWTSIIASLILSGMGEHIASCQCPKIVLLNSCYDRETYSISALNYLFHIASSLNRYGVLCHPLSAYINHLFVVEGAEIPVDISTIEQLGVQVHTIPKTTRESFLMQNRPHPTYSLTELIRALKDIMSK